MMPYFQSFTLGTHTQYQRHKHYNKRQHTHQTLLYVQSTASSDLSLHCFIHNITMSYGIASFDLGKLMVLLSCMFNAFMAFWIAKDPIQVIQSPHGGGWWDPLQVLLAMDDESNDNKVALYPRIWATLLIFQLVVRVNWVFTNETSPELYRCVLVSYMLPLVQYLMECVVFQSLPSVDPTLVAMMVVPWLAIIIGYPKYTKDQQQSDGGNKAKPNIKKV